MHMRTTFILRDDLYYQAVKLTGIEEKTKLIHLGLQALIREAASKKLSQLHGTIPKASIPSRKKRIWS